MANISHDEFLAKALAMPLSQKSFTLILFLFVFPQLTTWLPDLFMH